ITVFQIDGQYLSHDNRRLWCLKNACDESKVVKCKVIEAGSGYGANQSEWGDFEWKHSTAMEGKDIVVMPSGQLSRTKRVHGENMHEIRFFIEDWAKFEKI
ncbi:unnamed protein product, partial [Amoebophrya sp. A25]